MKITAIVVGGIVVTFLVLGSMGETPEQMKARYVESAPKLAAGFGYSESQNQCIVNTANRLSATRNDYATMAIAACKVAADLANH